MVKNGREGGASKLAEKNIGKKEDQYYILKTKLPRSRPYSSEQNDLLIPATNRQPRTPGGEVTKGLRMTPSRIPLLVSPMLFGTRGRAIAAAANATPRRAKIKQAEPTFGVRRAPATRKVRHDSFQDRAARLSKFRGS